MFEKTLGKAEKAVENPEKLLGQKKRRHSLCLKVMRLELGQQLVQLETPKWILHGSKVGCGAATSDAGKTPIILRTPKVVYLHAELCHKRILRTRPSSAQWHSAGSECIECHEVSPRPLMFLASSHDIPGQKLHGWYLAGRMGAPKSQSSEYLVSNFEAAHFVSC